MQSSSHGQTGTSHGQTGTSVEHERLRNQVDKLAESTAAAARELHKESARREQRRAAGKTERAQATARHGFLGALITRMHSVDAIYTQVNTAARTGRRYHGSKGLAVLASLKLQLTAVNTGLDDAGTIENMQKMLNILAFALIDKQDFTRTDQLKHSQTKPWRMYQGHSSRVRSSHSSLATVVIMLLGDVLFEPFNGAAICDVKRLGDDYAVGKHAAYLGSEAVPPQAKLSEYLSRFSLVFSLQRKETLLAPSRLQFMHILRAQVQVLFPTVGLPLPELTAADHRMIDSLPLNAEVRSAWAASKRQQGAPKFDRFVQGSGETFGAEHADSGGPGLG